MGKHHLTLLGYALLAIAVIGNSTASARAGDRGQDIAATCGATGNQLWTVGVAATTTALATSSTDIYVSTDGGSLQRRSKTDGSVLASRVFSGISLGKPLYIERTKAGTQLLCITGSDGTVYGLSPIDLSTLWSRSVRRAACTGDQAYDELCVQLFDKSNAAYQSAQARDLIFVGTRMACGTTTANKVYALDAANGTVAWTFNATGAYAVDACTGLTVNYVTNQVVMCTDKRRASQAQNTVNGLNSMTGARVWGVDIGSIHADPLIAAGSLYVVTTAGTVYKLNQANGSTVWSQVIGGQGSIDLDMTFGVVSTATRLLFVTSAGELYAVDDLGASAASAWKANLGALLALTTPCVLQRQGVLFVMTDMGGVFYQIGLCNGKIQNAGDMRSFVDPIDNGGHEFSTPGNKKRDVEAAQSAVNKYDLLIDTLDPVQSALFGADGMRVNKLCVPWSVTVMSARQDDNNNGTPDCLEGLVSSVDASDEATELLSQNQPNPFDGTTTIRFALARSGSVRLSIVNIAGQTIADLAQGEFEMGRHSLVWDGRDRNGRPVPTGLYLARLQTQDGMATIRMMLIR